MHPTQPPQPTLHQPFTTGPSPPRQPPPTCHSPRRHLRRAGSDEDKKGCTLIWQGAERRLWNDPELTLGDDWFAAGFGTDEALLADRMYFVVAPDGQLVGTTTAWYDGDPKATRGVVHYVGMLSEYAGRGLSKPLMTAVLLRLRELGPNC